MVKVMMERGDKKELADILRNFRKDGVAWQVISRKIDEHPKFKRPVGLPWSSGSLCHVLYEFYPEMKVNSFTKKDPATGEHKTSPINKAKIAQVILSLGSLNPEEKAFAAGRVLS